MIVFYSSLLYYNCSDGPIARDHSDLRSVATMLVHSSGSCGWAVLITAEDGWAGVAASQAVLVAGGSGGWAALINGQRGGV
jgi:hypothetical protein